MGLWDTNRSVSISKTRRNINNEKRIFHLVDLEISAESSVKIKESEKNRKILWSWQRAEKAVKQEGDVYIHHIIQSAGVEEYIAYIFVVK